jgi:hypothetical protein
VKEGEDITEDVMSQELNSKEEKMMEDEMNVDEMDEMMPEGEEPEEYISKDAKEGMPVGDEDIPPEEFEEGEEGEEDEEEDGVKSQWKKTTGSKTYN